MGIGNQIKIDLYYESNKLQCVHHISSRDNFINKQKLNL